MNSAITKKQAELLTKYKPQEKCAEYMTELLSLAGYDAITYCLMD